jgi:hypothetical protein
MGMWRAWRVKGNAYRILMGKLEGKEQLGRHRNG